MQPDPRDLQAAGIAFLEEDSNGWLVTFSDLVLQLFGFVVVAAVLGAGRPAPVVDEPVAAPGRLAASMPRTSEPRAPEFDLPDALSLARFNELPPLADEPPNADDLPSSAAMQDAVAVLQSVAAESVAVAAAVEPARVATEATASLATDLERFVAEAGLRDGVQVAVKGGGVTLSISDTIGFASGRAELLPDAAPVLAKVRSLVEARPELAVEVAGHTDDRPVHGGAFASNLDLSLARAARVAHELAGGDGDVAARIFAAGYGPQRPVASNDEPEGRARNRRVEIRLLPE